jgi:uncharacterized protein YndB with AHSA1/START domain
VKKATFARVAIGALAVPGVALAVVAIWGSLLPREHTSTVSRTIAAPADAVSAALTDVRSFPRWREGVERVEVLDESADRIRFKEFGEHGEFEFALERVDPRRIESRIVGEDQGFGGTWTFELAPAGDSTRVTITEDGWVDNVIFRFLSKYAFGHDATQNEYLSSLEARFNR